MLLGKKKKAFVCLFCFVFLAAFNSPNISRANLKNDTNGKNLRLTFLDNSREVEIIGQLGKGFLWGALAVI